ncbi:SDR family oxidoreductase [Chitinispirillales bacterium ANBcel5]|uniref:SDR family oxidoreductase n=1 Tax=Cellulosispirillum alkaliphilum TaxID=3039283 RepID=UPI002A4EB268|nr:SDR family oxidoreductase [Chitinispirillales bacterium ANBcel5]
MKILIIGASGFLGFHLLREALRENTAFDITATYNHTKLALTGVKNFKCDLCKDKNLSAVIETVTPDTLIYCAAVASPETCERHPKLSLAINTQTPAHIAKLCYFKGVRFIYTSTDLIFDGESAPYREDSPPSPINTYGKHKHLAEKSILSSNPHALICRLPLLYGFCANKKNFTMSVIDSLRANRRVNLFHDEFRTPANASDVARFLLQCPPELSGTLHLGGKEIVSRYQFGGLIAEIFELNKSLIAATSQRDIVTSAARPRDVSLLSEKAFSLGYCPKTVVEGLLKLKEELRNG